MKLVSLGYPALVELERFPESQRSRVYRSTFRRLMREDTEFRRRISRFRLSILGLSAVFLFFTWMLTDVVEPNIWRTVVGVPASIIGLLAYTVYVCRSTHTVGMFQCERIAKTLRDGHGQSHS